MSDVRFIPYDDGWLRAWAQETREDIREQRRILQEHTLQDSSNFAEMQLGLDRLQTKLDTVVAKKCQFYAAAKWCILIAATIASGSPMLFDYIVGIFRR